MSTTTNGPDAVRRARPRLTAPRSLLGMLLLGLAAVLPVPAVAEPTDPTDYQQVVDITFPLEADVPVRYRDDYDDPRTSTRNHQATDLMVAPGTPVYAAMGGRVAWMSGDRLLGPPSYGWMVRILGDDGRSYAYVHLGWDDRPWEDAYAPGIERGMRVERGQLIGWAACSGSASCGGGEHLHFEIHDPLVDDPYDYHDHERINPYRSLVAAESRGDYPDSGPSGLGVAYAAGAGSGGPFSDIGSTVHQRDIRELDRAGVAIACATGFYCPDAPLRRAEMAALLTRALDLPPVPEQFTDVPGDHLYAAEIGALAGARITLGCNPPANDEFCPEQTVTRQQMASFFTRALDLEPREQRVFEDVADSNVHWRDIAALARSGITYGCNPPHDTRFCPSQDVTRAQMASFIIRGIDLPDAAPDDDSTDEASPDDEPSEDRRRGRDRNRDR